MAPTAAAQERAMKFQEVIRARDGASGAPM